MAPLTQLERRACEVLLAAARARITLDALKAQMRRDGVPDHVWQNLYDALGLDAIVGGEGEMWVHAPDNIVPFVLKRKSMEPTQRTQGGAA